MMPLSAVSNPAIILRRVDFPEPLIPSTPILSPFLTVNERSLNKGLLGQAIARDSMSRRVIYNDRLEISEARRNEP
jgi:hypothetical protein